MRRAAERHGPPPAPFKQSVPKRVLTCSSNGTPGRRPTAGVEHAPAAPGAGAALARSTSMAEIAGTGSGVLMGVAATGAAGGAAVKAGAGPAAAEGKTARCMLTGSPLGPRAAGAAAAGEAAQARAGGNPPPTYGIGG